MSSQFDPEKGAAMLRQAEEWTKEQQAKEKSAFEDARRGIVEATKTLPEKVEVPYSKTPEGERWKSFKTVCDERFLQKTDYALVRDRAAFDRIASWDGQSPGVCAVGPTGMGKTFASWQALRRLYVRDNHAFAWFPAKRLCTEMQKYEERNIMEDFYRFYDFYRILFVDDLEKINWQFQSNSEMIFAFFDWIYRTKKPCIVTTNCGRAWWDEKMGEAFARRLFVDACVEVEFK